MQNPESYLPENRLSGALPDIGPEYPTLRQFSCDGQTTMFTNKQDLASVNIFSISADLQFSIHLIFIC